MADERVPADSDAARIAAGAGDGAETPRVGAAPLPSVIHLGPALIDGLPLGVASDPLERADGDGDGSRGGDGKGRNRDWEAVDPETQARVDARVEEIFSRSSEITVGTLAAGVTQATNAIDTLLRAAQLGAPSQPQRLALSAFLARIDVPPTETIRGRLQELRDDAGLIERDGSGQPLSTPDTILDTIAPIAVFTRAMLPDYDFSSDYVPPSEIQDSRVIGYMEEVHRILPYLSSVPEALAVAEAQELYADKQTPLTGFAEAVVQELATRIGFDLLTTTEDGQPMPYEEQRAALLARIAEIANVLRLSDGTDDQPDNVRGLEAVFAAADVEASERQQENDRVRLGRAFLLVKMDSYDAQRDLEAATREGYALLIAREVTARGIGDLIRPYALEPGGPVYKDAVVEPESMILADHVLRAAYELDRDATMQLLEQPETGSSYEAHAERAAVILEGALAIINRHGDTPPSVIQLRQYVRHTSGDQSGDIGEVVNEGVANAAEDIRLGKQAVAALEAIRQRRVGQLRPALEASAIVTELREIARGENSLGGGVTGRQIDLPTVGGEPRRYLTSILLDTNTRARDIATALGDSHVAATLNDYLIGAQVIHFIPESFPRVLQSSRLGSVLITYYDGTTQELFLRSSGDKAALLTSPQARRPFRHK